MAEIPPATIGGQPASLADAVARAAIILGASRNACVGGLAADIAGIEAAVALARRIGAAVDHCDAPSFRSLDVMRQDGWIATTPLQARARADLLVLVGPGIAGAWPDFAGRLAARTPPALAPDRPRTIIRIGVDAATAAQTNAAETVDAAVPDLPQLLGVLRALAGGRNVRSGPFQQAALGRCAALLGEGRYGVIVWSAMLETLAVEMLVGLIDDLNRAARWAALPLGFVCFSNAEGAAQAAAWLTGFPPGTGFARGHAEHDPWRFSARRMVESGEADAVLWLASAAHFRPSWMRGVPAVALVPATLAFSDPQEVKITVGQPGVDHDGVLHDPDLGTLAHRRAARPSAVPPAADVLRQIMAALPC